MLYNLNNIDKIFYNNKEYSSMYIKNKEVFTNEIKKIQKYYYTKDPSYINFFSEDFKNKGSIKLPSVLSGCTIKYDFIYNCFVGYDYTDTNLKIVYFTIDILNKTLNISMKIENYDIKSSSFSSSLSAVYYIPGGLFKLRRTGQSTTPSGYNFYHIYSLFNPYNSEYIDFKKTEYGQKSYNYTNTNISSLNIEKNTNKLVISTYGTNFSYSDTELYLRLIVNKNGDKIKVEWKEDENNSNYDYYWRNTNDNNIALRFDNNKRYYYNSEKKLNNYTSNPGYNFNSNNFECRMIKNNKYYFLNNYEPVPYLDIVDCPITENKEIKSIYCYSNSCSIPIILNNELYLSNFYDKIVKYNEETSSFDLIDNFIDFGTSRSQGYVCFI